jgi:hypothetical protein
LQFVKTGATWLESQSGSSPRQFFGLRETLSLSVLRGIPLLVVIDKELKIEKGG